MLDLKSMVSISGASYKSMDSTEAAQFLSAAESPEEWRLRIEYLVTRKGDQASKEFWEQVSKHSWVITTATVLGMTIQQLAQGVEV